MMFERLPIIVHVAIWEFRRFYKLRDQMLSLILAVVGGAIGFGVQYFVGKASGPVRVAVIGSGRLPALVLPDSSRLELTNHEPAEEPHLRDAVGRRALDGLLIIFGPDGAELFVSKEPIWQRDLQAALTDARCREKLKVAALDERQVNDLFAPLPLAVAYHPAGRGASSTAEKLVAAAFVGLTCLGVFLGMASFFAGITGEKAMRVTEQVVAAISPQTWVDGKLVGLTAAAFGSVLTYAAALCIFLSILWLGGASFSIPWTAMRPGNLLLYALLSLLGLLFWNCAFAAIAVTINDPNSSARSSLMFLPLMFVGMGFPGLQTPDSNVMRALSVMPGTSPTVMTARLVLSDVQPWEVFVTIGVMFLAIAALRRVAGRVFAANILLTGKELTWREMFQGLRSS